MRVGIMEGVESTEFALCDGAVRPPCFRRRTIRGTVLLSRKRARTTDIDEPGSDRSSKFIFDLMEPEPPKVDRAVLDFVKGHVFDPADFVIRSDGVCARIVVAKV
jgi:hypothetical protein